VSGCRRPPTVTRLVLATAITAVALAPLACAAQTLPPSPDPDVDLLAPSLDGNPAYPPRFRPPGTMTTAGADQPLDTGTFTAPSRIGATPVYGSPTGFGAGDTGFDSSNTPRSKRRKQKAPDSGTAIAPPPETTFSPSPVPETTSAPQSTPSQVQQLITPALPPTPPPVIYPRSAASRPGAALPDPTQPPPVSNPPPVVYPLSAASRPGAELPVPVQIPIDLDEASASTPSPGTPPLNTLPLGTPSRPPPIAGGDPYEQLGIKAGSFLILPAVELSTAYDTNPQRSPNNGPGSVYFVVAPELHVRSDWSQNSLTADISGTYSDYATSFTPSINRPYFNSKIDGTIDVSRYTQILLENRVIVSTDYPGSPNIAAGLASLPIDTTVGGTLGVIQTFNRLSVSLKGNFDRTTWEDSTLTNGETANNDDRNYDQYAGILRVGYEIDPGMKPFVELSEDERDYDQQFDQNGQQRSSTGTSAKIGADFDVFGSLTGEMAVGYLERFYIDPLPNIGGVTVDGSLIWQATGLTTAKLTAASTVTESTVENVAGEFTRGLNLEVDHALRRWLIATGTIGYARDEYVGEPRDDNRYFASAGLTYIFNRTMQLKGVVRHDWLTSTATGVAYDSTSVMLTLRLQR
jgi:hypothetical protein